MDTIKNSEISSILTSLENIRQKHYNTWGYSSLKTPYSTSGPGVDTVNNRSTIQEIKNDVTNLTNSPNIDSSYSSKVTVPDVESYIKAAQYTVIEDVVKEINNLCANKSNYTSPTSQGNYSTFDTQGDFTDFDTFDTRSNFSDYDHWGDFFTQSNFDTSFC